MVMKSENGDLRTKLKGRLIWKLNNRRRETEREGKKDSALNIIIYTCFNHIPLHSSNFHSYTSSLIKIK